jgi:hypothetical protein
MYLLNSQNFHDLPPPPLPRDLANTSEKVTLRHWLIPTYKNSVPQTENTEKCCSEAILVWLTAAVIISSCLPVCTWGRQRAHGANLREDLVDNSAWRAGGTRQGRRRVPEIHTEWRAPFQLGRSVVQRRTF